jgi:hypothetical protein
MEAMPGATGVGDGVRDEAEVIGAAAEVAICGVGVAVEAAEFEMREWWSGGKVRLANAES